MNKVQVFENDNLSLSLRTIENEDGSISINLEDAARGLGFTTVATSGNECVRWSRVNKYLKEFSFSSYEHDDYIPESIFYLLAMKASNAIAIKFQKWVAIDVIPSIRKNGSYGQHEKTEALLNNMIDLSKELIVLTKSISDMCISVTDKLDKTESKELVNTTTEAHSLDYSKCKLDSFPENIRVMVNNMMEEMINQEQLNFSAIARVCIASGYNISSPSVKTYYEKHFKKEQKL